MHDTEIYSYLYKDINDLKVPLDLCFLLLNKGLGVFISVATLFAEFDTEFLRIPLRMLTEARKSFNLQFHHALF